MEVRHRGGRRQAVGTLEDLAKQQLITVLDAATVSWPEGPSGRRRVSCTTSRGGRPRRRVLGLLFGLLFFVPLLGMAIGAAAGA